MDRSGWYSQDDRALLEEDFEKLGEPTAAGSEYRVALMETAIIDTFHKYHCEHIETRMDATNVNDNINDLANLTIVDKEWSLIFERGDRGSVKCIMFVGSDLLHRLF